MKGKTMTTPTTRSRWVRIGLPVAGALIAGIAIGGSGGDETVAAPTPEPVTVTEEIEVEVVPQACLDAIKAAEEVAADNGEFATIMIRYPDIVVDATQAGFAQDVAGIEAVTADIRKISAEVIDLTDTIKGHVAQFKAGRAGCK